MKLRKRRKQRHRGDKLIVCAPRAFRQSFEVFLFCKITFISSKKYKKDVKYFLLFLLIQRKNLKIV